MFNKNFAQKIYSNEEWTNFTGNIPTYSRTSSVVLLDGSIIAINSNTNTSGNSDVLISKYKKTGQLVWQTTFDGGYSENDYGVKIIKNSNGYFYVAAIISVSSTNSNYGLLKLDSDGNMIWSKEWDAHGGHDEIADLVLDDSGNIYVTGAADNGGGFSDFATQRYTPNGDLEWTTFYDYANLHDVGVKLSIKNSKINVIGTSASDLLTWDNVSVQLDISDGSEIDVVRASIPGTGFDNPTSLVTGTNNSLFITGYVEINGNKDIQLLKINSDNTIGWMKTYDGGFEDVSSVVDLDNFGNIYVTGFSRRGNGTQDYVTIKYDTNGVQKWIKTYRALGSTKNSIATGLKVDYDGRLFVSGTIEENGQRFFNTIYYDSTGNILHVMKYEDLSGLYETPNLIINGNDLYLTGIRNSAGGRALTAIRYSFSERQEQSVIINNIPSHISKELIFAFNKNVINNVTINNKSLNFGPLSIFVDSSVIDSLNLTYPKVFWNEVETFKIFQRMTLADSISISRNGHEINVYPFWSTLILKFKDVNELSLIDSLTGKLTNYIDYIQTNALFSTESNDPLFSNQHALVSATYPEGHINVENAWAIETGKSNIKVGVYDTGIKYNHEDFGGYFGGDGCKVKDGKDYLNGISFVNIPNAGDENTGTSNNGHGTKIAGIIGALRNNHISVAGVGGGNWPYANASGEGVQTDPTNPETENVGLSLYGFRIFNGSNVASLSTVCNALVEGSISSSNGYGYGLDIINNSWKMVLQQPFMENAILMRNCQREIFRNQTVHVASRGNNVGTDINFPSEADREFWVINVGGSGTDGNLHPQSGYAGNMDLIAPFPAELATTVSNLSTTATSTISGTSASAAFVSGTAGLMLSHINDRPETPNNLAPDDVEFLLQRYAKDKTLGLGYSNGYDDLSGWGLLDAGKTLEKIDRSEYIVKHYELETTLDLTGISPQSVQRFVRTNSGTGGNNFLCDIYTVSFSIPNNLNPGDIILDYWPLNSYTTMYRHDHPSGFIDREYQCGITNMTQNNGTIKASVVHLIQNLDNGAPYDYWMPALQGQTIRVGYSLHLKSDYAFVNEETINKYDFSCYPNPTNGDLYLDFILKENADVSFEIVDINGAILHKSKEQKYSTGQQNLNLNVSGWASGIYIVKLTCNNEISHAKFIKN